MVIADFDKRSAYYEVLYLRDERPLLLWPVNQSPVPEYRTTMAASRLYSTV